MMNKMQASWHSFRSLPGWVQIWVGLILVPANALPFFFLNTWAGMAGAIAAVVVIATNGPIMLWYQGMNRALSLPHLVVWIPLETALVLRALSMAGNGAPEPAEMALIVVLLIINGISLVFDALDSWRWLKGERETPRPAQ